MKEKIFEFSDLAIWKENEKFFAYYDAGSHQVMMRKDEISEDEARTACEGPESATRMLMNLQRRLVEMGVDPYRSNWESQPSKE